MWDSWRHGEAVQIFRFLIISMVLQRTHLFPRRQVTPDCDWQTVLRTHLEFSISLLMLPLYHKNIFKINMLDLQRTFLLRSKQASGTWPTHLVSQDRGYLPDVFSTAEKKAGPTVVSVDQHSVVPCGWSTAGCPKMGVQQAWGTVHKLISCAYSRAH